MKVADIPGKVPAAFGYNAGGAYIRETSTTSKIGVTDGQASYPDGFVPLNFTPVGAGGVPPFGKDANGILNAISGMTWAYSAGAILQWDGTFSAAIGGYPKGAVVASVATFGVFWLCTADDNTTNPDSAGAGWAPFNGLAIPWAIAGGSADAIIATYAPAVALSEGLLVSFRAGNANATATPTFAPNGLTAHTITKSGGLPLVAGDIYGDEAEYFLRYNLAETCWELLNPASPTSIPWVVAGGAADAITATYAPTITALTDGLLLSFRAAAANASTAPTFAPNGLTAHAITQHGGAGLVAGNIAGNYAEYIVRYNLANTRWELLNPTYIPSSLVAPYTVFATIGTTTEALPANVTKCRIRAKGGGGGGGDSPTGDGGDGGNTTVVCAALSLSMTAGGGKGGKTGAATLLGGLGGAGGTASGGVANFPGAPGCGGHGAQSTATGGSGGGAGGGPGGSGSPSTAPTVGATDSGGGGGGAPGATGNGGGGGGGEGAISEIFLAVSGSETLTLSIGTYGAAGGAASANGATGYVYIEAW